MTAAPPMVCAICTHRLATITTRDDHGKLHTDYCHHEPTNHRPVPVPPGIIDDTALCDFCGTPTPRGRSPSPDSPSTPQAAPPAAAPPATGTPATPAPHSSAAATGRSWPTAPSPAPTHASATNHTPPATAAPPPASTASGKTSATTPPGRYGPSPPSRRPRHDQRL